MHTVWFPPWSLRSRKVQGVTQLSKRFEMFGTSPCGWSKALRLKVGTKSTKTSEKSGEKKREGRDLNATESTEGLNLEGQKKNGIANTMILVSIQSRSNDNFLIFF